MASELHKTCTFVPALSLWGIRKGAIRDRPCGNRSEGTAPMPLAINKEEACAKSRLAAHRLISMRLRLLDLWREVTGGHEESLVVMAVVAITGDRLTRTDVIPELRNIAHAVPQALLGKCNISSIAAATGLNRETARRVVNRLIERGILQRSSDRSINFTSGRMQGPNAVRISEMQLEEFTRTANALMRDGVLTFESEG
jgi:predicted transcriptional regulator